MWPPLRRGWLFALGALLSVGCAGEVERAPIFGTLKGAEGRNGTITVTPAPPHEGPSSSAEVVEGKYEFDGETGPRPGPYVARIRLAPPPGAPALAPPASASAGKQPDKVPTVATFGRDPVMPVAEEKTVSIEVPKEGPWQLDIPWK